MTQPPMFFRHGESSLVNLWQIARAQLRESDDSLTLYMADGGHVFLHGIEAAAVAEILVRHSWSAKPESSE